MRLVWPTLSSASPARGILRGHLASGWPLSPSSSLITSVALQDPWANAKILESLMWATFDSDRPYDPAALEHAVRRLGRQRRSLIVNNFTRLMLRQVKYIF